MLFCPKCGGIVKAVKSGIYKCWRCDRYYTINDQAPNVLNVDERFRIDVLKVLKVNCGKELNVAQFQAYDKISKDLSENGRIRGIISLPTGSGKTLLSACLLRFFFKFAKIWKKGHVLVLAPRRIIREQIAKSDSDFQNMFKDVPIIVQSITGDADSSGSKQLLDLLNKQETFILVSTPQLINRIFKRYNGKVDFGRVRALILDEVHHTYNGSEISESIRYLIEKCDFVLGLSATPTRESVENVGKVLFHYPARKAMEDGILVSQVKFYRYDTKVMDLPREVSDEWEVAIRNRAETYAEKILEVLRKERKEIGQERIFRTAIACPNINEANMLFDVLKDKVENVYIIHYKVPNHEKQLKSFLRSDDGILISVNMIDIGFDDRDLEVLVLARPLKSHISYVQLRGRVLRKPISDWNIKQNYALIIDLVDNYERHEKFIDSVALGEEEAGKFESDLRGKGEAPEVEAKVEVKEKGVILYPNLMQPAIKPSTTYTSPQHHNIAYVYIEDPTLTEKYVNQALKYLRNNKIVTVKSRRISYGDVVIEQIKKKIEKKMSVNIEPYWRWRKIDKERYIYERKITKR